MALPYKENPPGLRGRRPLEWAPPLSLARSLPADLAHTAFLSLRLGARA